MTATDETKPHPIERWIERSLPDYRFGLVLVLLLITFAFMASGVTGASEPNANVTPGSHAPGSRRASKVGRRRFRFAALVVLIIHLVHGVALLELVDARRAPSSL
jgi:hypothetical protein